MSFQTVQYIPNSRKAAIREMPVSQILAVAHEPKPWGNKFTNHWCLYLQTGTNSSIRVDMAPSVVVPGTVIVGGSKGILLISELDCLYSRHAQKVIEIPTQSGLRVSHIVDALVEAGRDKYEFDADGVGCRMWTTNSLTLIQQKSWGNSTQIQNALNAIGKTWPSGSALPLGRGAYY